jgi:hypothetical protein
MKKKPKNKKNKNQKKPKQKKPNKKILGPKTKCFFPKKIIKSAFKKPLRPALQNYREKLHRRSSCLNAIIGV